MNNFQFEKDENRPKDALDLLHAQKRKLATQQVIFAGLFIVVIILLGLYLVSRVIFVYYDGYIKLDVNNIRAMQDEFVLKMNVNVGDSVQPGDTLFSYVLLDQVVTHNDVTNEPVFVTRTNDMRMQGRLAQQQLIVLRTQLAELQKQLKSERNDIYYGLTNNTKQNEIKAQIEQVKAQIRETQNKVAIYMSRAYRNYNIVSRYGLVGNGQSPMPFSPGLTYYNKAIVHYCVAPAKGFVTRVMNPDLSLSFKGDDIVHLKYVEFDKANLMVMAYVPVDNTRELIEADSVEVIVDKETILHAHLVRVGLGTQQLPDYLVNNFTRDAMVIMAALQFDRDQQIPLWVLNNELPVKIRINKFLQGLKSRNRAAKKSDSGAYHTKDSAHQRQHVIPSLPKNAVPHVYE